MPSVMLLPFPLDLDSLRLQSQQGAQFGFTGTAIVDMTNVFQYSWFANKRRSARISDECMSIQIIGPHLSHDNVSMPFTTIFHPHYTLYC